MVRTEGIGGGGGGARGGSGGSDDVALSKGTSVVSSPGSSGAPHVVGNAVIGVGGSLNPNAYPIRNLPPHPGLLGPRPTWFGAPVQRGKIVKYKSGNFGSSVTTASGDFLLRDEEEFIFNFVFNPSSVAFSYQVSPDRVNPVVGLDGDIPTIGQTMLNFSLLVDRHLDVLEPPGSKHHSPSGVLDDMFILELLLGVKNLSQTNAVGAAYGIPVEVFFGTGPNAFRFIGHMETLSNEITHFSPDMVPVRMATAVTFRRIHDAATVVDAAAFDSISKASSVVTANKEAMDSTVWSAQQRLRSGG